MNIVAAQFQTIGGGAIDVQTLVASEDFSVEGGDWIKIYDASTRLYTKLFWYGVGYLYENADAPEPLAYAGWGDDSQNIADAMVDPSQGFWVQSVGGGTVLAKGEVASSGVVQIPENLMAIVANPFPVEVSVQSVVASEDFSVEGGDWIKLYDPTTRLYTKLFWYGQGYLYENADAAEPLPYAGWGDDAQNIASATINPGQGFWVQSVGGGTLTFPNPLATPAAGGND